MLGVGLLQLLLITCSLVARSVVHTLAAPALGPSVPETSDQTDLRPPPAVPGAAEVWPFARKLCSSFALCPFHINRLEIRGFRWKRLFGGL